MRDTDSRNDRLLLNRRGLLGTLGAGASAVAGVGMFSSPAHAWSREDVLFRGCSEVWIIVGEADIHYDPPTVGDIIVETTDGSLDCRRQYFTPETTTTIPGQFGDAPVLKYEISSGEKILGVIIYNYATDDGINTDIPHPLMVNPNQCASTPGTPNPTDAECAENTYTDPSRIVDGPGNGGSGGRPDDGNDEPPDNGDDEPPSGGGPPDDRPPGGGPPSDGPPGNRSPQ